MQLHFFQWWSHNAMSKNQSERTLLLFLHGMGGTGQIWRPIAAHLEDHFLCIAPDQRGHGQSRPVPDTEKNNFHASDYARDLLPLLEKIVAEHHPSRLILIGHSMGVRSGLATAHAILKSAPSELTSIFQGFVSVDIGLQGKWGGGIGMPLADFIEKLPESFPDRNSMRDYLFQHCPDPAIAQYLSAVSKKTSDSPEAWSFPFDHSALVRTIHQADEAPIEKWIMEICDAGIPVLALRGMNSKVWLKPDYEKAKAQLAHPNLHFEEWENCGHGLPFEQRQRFLDRIREFSTR